MNRKTMVSFKTNMRHQNLKRVRKGMLAPLVVVFLSETSRESGRGEAGLVTGRPCRHRGLPPPPPPQSPSNTHGSSSYLVRSHDALELSFRSERSQLPGLALWAACAAASATGNTGNIAPKTENLLGKCRAPNAFRSHRGNKGVYYRGEKGRQMSVHIRCVFRV